MATIVGVSNETPTRIMFSDSSNPKGTGGVGDGQLTTGTPAIWYSLTMQIPDGEMPADIMFDFKSSLNQIVTCTLQGCNSSDFTSTPVHDLPNPIVLADGSVTAQTDYGYGPPRFKYYRFACVASAGPTAGGVDIWATAFKS